MKFYLRCHNIHLNGTGNGDCSSLWNGIPWCYIIGEDSGCKDKQKLAQEIPQEFESYQWKDIYFSEDACAENRELPWKVGLEDFLPGYEVLGSDPPKEYGGGGFYAPTPEACETECYNRGSKYCNAWTFIPGESGECFLKADFICENTLRVRRQTPKAISGFLCNQVFYDHPIDDHIQCWSTTDNLKNLYWTFCDYLNIYSTSIVEELFSDGSKLENLSGTVSFTGKN